MPLRVALVEDHAGTREALVHGLADHPERVQVVGVFASGEGFLGAEPDADVVLVDLGLPGMSGVQVIGAVTRERPAMRSVALTIFDDEDTVVEALAAGAGGFLLKDEPIDRVLSAIEEVTWGGRPLSSAVAGFLIERALRFSPPVILTEREAEVAEALAAGLSYADCGRMLGIATSTVQDFVKRIYKKIDIRSKRELRLWLAQQKQAHT